MLQRFLFLIATLFSASLLVAQGRSSQSVEKGWGVPDKPLNCEMNFQNLEHVRTLIRGQVNQKSVLILIARLGNGERQQALNHRRLYNVRLKLTGELNVPEEKIIIAQGERLEGFGRVEFYLGGELVGALLANQQSDICVGCCGPDERFYPYKGKFEFKPKQRRRAT